MHEVLGHHHDARCADRQQRNGRESPDNGMPGKPSGLRLTPLGPFLFLGFEPHALGIDELASRWLWRDGGVEIIHHVLYGTCLTARAVLLDDDCDGAEPREMKVAAL